jgi:hypothetical protein
MGEFYQIFIISKLKKKKKHHLNLNFKKKINPPKNYIVP